MRWHTNCSSPAASGDHPGCRGGVQLKSRGVMSRCVELQSTTFREIAFQLIEGNPWWGMLLLNHQIKDDSYMRRALITTFRRRITASPPHSATQRRLAERLIAGASSSELTPAQRAFIGPRALRAPRRTVPAAHSLEHLLQNRIEWRDTRRPLPNRPTARRFAPHEDQAAAHTFSSGR